MEEIIIRKRVFIGVGHGGKDPGAVANGYKESNLNLAVAKACAAYLERHGVEVLLSRTSDVDDPVTEVVRECNAFSPTLAVNIHINAGGGTGFEAYYTIGGGTGKTLAQNIETEIKALGKKSRGIKTRIDNQGRDYYAFVRDTKAPAVILETAFIDSSDIKLIDSDAERVAYGEAYARGILKTLGVNDDLTGKIEYYEDLLAKIRALVCS